MVKSQISDEQKCQVDPCLTSKSPGQQYIWDLLKDLLYKYNGVPSHEIKRFDKGYKRNKVTREPLLSSVAKIMKGGDKYLGQRSERAPFVLR